jgi:hypothetical protein
MEPTDNFNKAEIQDPDFDRFLDKKKLHQTQSSNPLVQLKRTILYSIIWSVILGLVYAAMFYLIPIWQVKVTLALVLAFCLWSFVETFRLYRSIQPLVIPGNSVLAEMKRHYSNVNQWMIINQRVGLLLYPFAITGGFILGGVIGSGKPVSAFLYKPVMLLALAICILVWVPLSYMLAKWMFKVSFGKQLQLLSERIAALEIET